VKRLICTVGRGELKDVTYSLGGRTYRSRFAPVALAHLLSLQGGSATVLVTEAAKDRWYEELEAELKAAGVVPEAVLIPEGRTENELLSVLVAMERRVGEEEEVVLDVTHSLRHLAFVFMAALVYLTALKRVRLAGIFYGAFELRDGEAAPIINLGLLFTLVELYTAVETGLKSGDLRPLARLFSDKRALLWKEGTGRSVEQDLNQLSKTADCLEQLGEALAAGLPLEAGIHARRTADVLAKFEVVGAEAAPRLAADRLALEPFRERLLRIAVDAPAKRKTDLCLDRREIERLLAVVEWYLDRRDVPRALILLEETLISLALWSSWVGGEGTGRAEWLDEKARRQGKGLLDVLVERNRYGLCTEAEAELAKQWSRLRGFRNRLAHAGFKKDEGPVQAQDARELVDYVRSIVDCFPRPAEKARGRLLVAPLGLSPGSLYTALRHTFPDEAIVLASRQSAPRLPEVLKAAGFEGLPKRVLEFNDPLRGYHEISKLIDSSMRACLASKAEVTVCLTGGPTLMQYAASLLAEEARKLGVPVREVAAIDGRSPAEQAENPYVLGEVVTVREDGPIGGNEIKGDACDRMDGATVQEGGGQR